MNNQHEMDCHQDVFRKVYEQRAPRHRMNEELLANLEVQAAHVSRYPAIHINVYHMGGQSQQANLDHDVIVNTEAMKYVVELHETSLCLVGEKEKDEFDQYCPCDCHEVLCQTCQQSFMAMTEVCLERNSCNEENCEYCGHYRDECASGKITAELIGRARFRHKEPNRQDGRTFYHQHLVNLKGTEALTLAESYAVAISEVFRGHEAVLYPVVRVMLDRQATSLRRETPLGNTIWRFEDGSTLEEKDGLVHTVFL